MPEASKGDDKSTHTAAARSKLEAVAASGAGLASVQPDLQRATVSPGQIACLLTYAGVLALWAYAELVDFSRYAATPFPRASGLSYMSTVPISCRQGKRSSQPDEEHGPVKESPPAMQPVGVSQVELQLQINNGRDSVPDTSIARCGFVRYGRRIGFC